VRTARERWKRGLLERKWGRERGRVGLGAQVARGGAVASSTRDVGAEKAAARSSGGSYAGKTGLTGRAREQRERGESGGGRAEGGRADGRARQGRESGGRSEARARDGLSGPKGRGGGRVGLLFLFLLF
jgi:hypothetical protein